MKPLHFKEANRKLTAPKGMEDNCDDLHVFNDGTNCISKWEPSVRERFKLLFGANIWLWVVSGKTQPPVAIQVAKTIFDKPKKATEKI